MDIKFNKYYNICSVQDPKIDPEIWQYLTYYDLGRVQGIMKKMQPSAVRRNIKNKQKI
jgi:hypothetical protein